MPVDKVLGFLYIDPLKQGLKQQVFVERWVADQSFYT